MTLDKVSELMAAAGIPGRDLYDLPESDLRFPDGTWYRYELPTIEHVGVLETVVKEAKKRNTKIHRVVGFFQGGILYDKAEIRDYAQLAKEEGIEVLVLPGPRVWWDIGRQATTSEGARCGIYHRGSDELRKATADLFRYYDAGIRGFFVNDIGWLDLLHTMQEQGNFPKDVVFKVSASCSPNHAAAVRLAERLGAGSVNPGCDLPLPILAGLRKTIKIPMDVYVYAPLSMGGVNRFYNAADIVRICAPVYLRIDPAPELTYGLNQPWASEDQYTKLAIKKVKYASIINEIIAENAPELTTSR